MTHLNRKDITRDFIRSKRPCTDGYRWYLKRQETLSDYQGLLDDLVAAGALDVAQGVEAAGSLRTQGHLQSGAMHGVSRSQNKSKIISKTETYKF